MYNIIYVCHFTILQFSKPSTLAGRVWGRQHMKIGLGTIVEGRQTSTCQSLPWIVISSTVASVAVTTKPFFGSAQRFHKRSMHTASVSIYLKGRGSYFGFGPRRLVGSPGSGLNNVERAKNTHISSTPAPTVRHGG